MRPLLLSVILPLFGLARLAHADAPIDDGQSALPGEATRKRADRQADSDFRSGRGSSPHGNESGRREIESLDEKDRQRVRAALSTVWNHPEVIAAGERLALANSEYREAIRNAMAKADPNVLDILERMERTENRQRRGSPSLFSRAMGVSSLPPEERKILDSARKMAMESKSVTEKRRAIAESRSNRERAFAHRDLQKLVLEEMRASDPRVEKILEKIQKRSTLAEPNSSGSRADKELDSQEKN